MKYFALFIMSLLLFSGCRSSEAQEDRDLVKVPAAKTGEQLATLGGGCFWSMAEALSELKGVNKVISGYAGGSTKDPTYEEVCSRTTGHAEVVQVYYDPKVISYETIIKGFFSAHDPTTLNRQGPDVGDDYRSIVFYRTPDEKKAVQNEIATINASKQYKDKVVTQFEPFKIFYGGEEYHQRYYKAHLGDNPYLRIISKPKVEAFRKAMANYLK